MDPIDFTAPPANPPVGLDARGSAPGRADRQGRDGRQADGGVG